MINNGNCAFLLQCIWLQHSVLAFLCMYMFMGLLACVFEACSRVLFADRRHGDVTVWYQRKVDNNGPLWAKNEQLTEVEFLSAQRKSDCKFYKKMV